MQLPAGLSEHWQSGGTLLIFALYVYDQVKKRRQESKELERLQQIQEDTNIEKAGSSARAVAADAMNLAELRSQFVEDQAKKIALLEARAGFLEVERDECRAELREIRERLRFLEGKFDANRPE